MRAVGNICLFIVLGAIAGACAAQGAGGGLRLGVGGGLEVGSTFGENFALRGWWPRDVLSRSLVETGAPDDSRPLYGTRLLVADWHPWSGGFRLSGGFGHVASLRALDREVAAPRLGGIEARIAPATVSPYLGVGWGRWPAASGGLYLSADIGLILQRSVSGDCALLSATVCRAVHTRAAEAERSVLDELRVLPRVSFGLGLRF
jgi:hypothetical protein